MASEDKQDNLTSRQLLPHFRRYHGAVSPSFSASSESASLNELDDGSADIEGVALLKQIFPEESTEELRRLHQLRLARRAAPGEQQSPRSKLGDRIRRRLSGSPQQWCQQNLPNDFLRLPPNVAVRRYCYDDGCWHYEIVRELQVRAIEQHRNLSVPLSEDLEFYTAVIFRDVLVGLGMNLFEERGSIRVHSLNDRASSPDGDAFPSETKSTPGPASKAGIRPHDVLVGINGRALLESVAPEEGLLQHTVSSLRMSPDPVVLHFLRSQPVDERILHEPPQIIAMQSLLDTSDFLEESPSVELSFQLDRTFRSTPIMHSDQGVLHPFVKTLSSNRLIKQGDAESLTSRMMSDFTERARQWEATGSFTGFSLQSDMSTFVPLAGIRKALSIRIVNSFLDGDETAYTIWVHDLETSREWYAPVRYFRDFQDLRAATQGLRPSVSQLPFPKPVLTIFGSPVRAETQSERETKCRQLESFLRSLNAMIYREAIHPLMAEIAVHVQSFLGCDSVLGEVGLLGLAVDETPSNKHDGYEARTRLALKRSIQLYTYRLFLLNALSSAVDTFVSSVRAQGPRLQDIESLEAEGRSALKARAIEDLTQIQAFLDKLQEIILEGCMFDLRSIAEREEYEAIHCRILGSVVDGSDDYWERLVREAVREQIEIEVYVPLRGIVSRWLVNGWKHEDMEVHFKIRELRKRPADFFGLSVSNPSQLNPVAATILREGVGQSTLPCVKLRAILDAASEINRIFSRKQDTGHDNEIHMGADEFLPIFIYCIVKAEMERPCALCILLRTLCDPINRVGETGYYLASFEAASKSNH